MKLLQLIASVFCTLACAVAVAKAAYSPEGSEYDVHILTAANITASLAETVTQYVESFATDRGRVIYSSGDESFTIELANGQAFEVAIVEKKK